MIRRIFRALTFAFFAFSFSGCLSTLDRTAQAVMRLPGSLIGAAARTVGNIGG